MTYPDPITINPNRIELDEAYMQMAEVWAKRSKANRLQVGALVVVGTRIVSDGYNGMPAGWHDDTCEYWKEDPNDLDGPGGCGPKILPTLTTKPELMHAEANALMKLAKYGTSGDGGTLYITDSPCPECAKLAHQAGIKRVVYRRPYRLKAGLEMLAKLGVQVDQLT